MSDKGLRISSGPANEHSVLYACPLIKVIETL